MGKSSHRFVASAILVPLNTQAHSRGPRPAVTTAHENRCAVEHLPVGQLAAKEGEPSFWIARSKVLPSGDHRDIVKSTGRSVAIAAIAPGRHSAVAAEPGCGLHRDQ